MLIRFTFDELTDLGIHIRTNVFEFIPKMGDYIMIQDFMEEKDKQIFEDHMNSIGKIVLGTVDAIVWNRVDNQNTVTLSLFFEDQKGEVNTFDDNDDSPGYSPTVSN